MRLGDAEAAPESRARSSSSDSVAADDPSADASLAQLLRADVALLAMRAGAGALGDARARLAAEVGLVVAELKDGMRDVTASGGTAAAESAAAAADECAREADKAQRALAASLTRLDGAVDAYDKRLVASLERAAGRAARQFREAAPSTTQRDGAADESSARSEKEAIEHAALEEKKLDERLGTLEGRLTRDADARDGAIATAAASAEEALRGLDALEKKKLDERLGALEGRLARDAGTRDGAIATAAASAEEILRGLDALGERLGAHVLQADRRLDAVNARTRKLVEAFATLGAAAGARGGENGGTSGDAEVAGFVAPPLRRAESTVCRLAESAELAAASDAAPDNVDGDATQQNATMVVRMPSPARCNNNSAADVEVALRGVAVLIFIATPISRRATEIPPQRHRNIVVVGIVVTVVVSCCHRRHRWWLLLVVVDSAAAARSSRVSTPSRRAATAAARPPRPRATAPSTAPPRGCSRRRRRRHSPRP